ncbi:hypothetical protein COOONC_21541 [Cooperia oncophora]
MHCQEKALHLSVLFGYQFKAKKMKKTPIARYPGAAVIVGIPGLYLNLLTSLSLLGASTPFEFICACHAAGDAAIIAVMVFWSAPMIFL